MKEEGAVESGTRHTAYIGGSEQEYLTGSHHGPREAVHCHCCSKDAQLDFGRSPRSGQVTGCLRGWQGTCS